MDEYVRDFVQESEEAITTLNNALLDLESDPDDDEAMDEIFRTAHTLKGNCGAMGFTDASDLAHAMEDLLDAVRAGEVEVTPSLMDQVFEGVDRLEAMLDETRRHGEPQSDPTPVIESLRAYVPDSADTRIEEPTDDAVESLLSAADRPTDGAHDVYHVRLDIAGGDDGILVVEALRDAFDLLGTDPPEDDIADGEFGGAFDAAFASPVGEAAISAALEPVDAVEAAIITDATDLSDGIAEPTAEPATGEPTADPEAASAAAADAEPDPDDVSVDELLDDDEVDQFEDLDSMVDEVDDVEGLDDLGDAGSFEGIEAEPEVSSLDEAADDDPSVDDVLDEAEDAVDAAETESDSGETADDGDEQVEDASSTFAELQDEVDPVGFDELQDELDELEFDEYEDEEEVGFDELLGDEAEADDDAFEDALDDVDAALAEEEESDDTVDATAEDATADSDDALEAESDAFDDLVADDGETADDPFGDDEIDGGDPFGQTADAAADADTVDADSTADPDADTANADTAADETVDDVLDEVGFGEESTATADEAGVTADEAEGEAASASADDATDDTSTVESSDFGDVDLDTGSTVDTTTDVGEFEGFDAPATEDAEETDEPAEEASADDAAAADAVATADAATTADATADDAAPSDDTAASSRSAIDQSGPTGRSEEIQSVRVDVEKVDRLMNLVEGMVTSRVRLRRAIERGDSLALLDQELDELEDITTELQDTVMDIRLVPLSTVANRLPRTVRDIAREQGKEVDFELLGGDVELDRSVLNEIGDPLVHIVRNAVDHGVEPPEEREAAGKDPEASVELRARRERDRVVIEVEDDGRGLDAERLRETAVEEGIRTRGEVESMDDEDVYDLVFTAGFSTSDEVTDVSGRGVGMDVVASTVEDLDGDVAVESEPGEGTTVRLTLPVTVAIADVLFVAAGEEEYGIPIKDVQEIGPLDDVSTADGEPVVRRDDEEYPLLDLADELDAPGPRRSGENMLVRVRDDVRPVAIECDEVRGQQEVVVKPYEGVLGDIPGLSGATVLGEGDVVNILDVESL
ncbi:Hpt domain-containing protein [Halostella salina]|uniref:Hpt domain-containing protein n=1 Tax=Halostella salina TaxID=1547897 RepID=UPI000EF83AF5|nr:Hpt domain-containing protein [Halostella salina]